jgi:hypothetical protein
MEMKCIFNIGKNISILVKVTQVSDVAHGPLVVLPFNFSQVTGIRGLENWRISTVKRSSAL